MDAKGGAVVGSGSKGLALGEGMLHMRRQRWRVCGRVALCGWLAPVLAGVGP